MATTIICYCNLTGWPHYSVVYCKRTLILGQNLWTFLSGWLRYASHFVYPKATLYIREEGEVHKQQTAWSSHKGTQIRCVLCCHVTSHELI